MEVTQEMYSKLFNAITDANIKLQQARKNLVQAELVLNTVQSATEELFLEQCQDTE